MSNININSIDGVKGIQLGDIVHSKMESIRQKIDMKVTANTLRAEKEKAESLMNMMERKGNQIDERY